MAEDGHIRKEYEKAKKEWEEVDISGMPKDSDGKVKIEGLGYIKQNYWRNTVTGEKEKPSGGAPLGH